MKLEDENVDDLIGLNVERDDNGLLKSDGHHSFFIKLPQISLDFSFDIIECVDLSKPSIDCSKAYSPYASHPCRFILKANGNCEEILCSCELQNRCVESDSSFCFFGMYIDSGSLCFSNDLPLKIKTSSFGTSLEKMLSNYRSLMRELLLMVK